MMAGDADGNRYVLSKGDRASFAASARKVASWDFDRIIP